MLFDWLIATLAGIGLGLVLYGCVRLRMRFAPDIRTRFGDRARHLFWIVTIVVMIVLANAGLLGLRTLLGRPPTPAGLVIEIWFALVTLGVPMALIFRRIRIRRG